MAILSKACKPDNFESHNSLRLSFKNIQGIFSNLVDCESLLESNYPDILALCETNLDDSIDSSDFSVRGYLFFFNWYSLHARLNSHGEAWSCKKRKHKKVKAYRKSI